MSRTLLVNPADRSQILLAIAGPVVLTFPLFVSLPPQFEIFLWIAVWTTISRHNYILHNHVHRPFTRSRWLNRAISAMLGFCTGMTAGMWKITHVHGHHVEDKLHLLPGRKHVCRFNIPDDERYSYFGAVRHALTTAPLQWLAPVRMMIHQSCYGGHFRRRFYRFYLAEFLLIYGVVGGMLVVNPLKSALYFGLIYGIVHVISRHVDYVTHVSSHGDPKYGFANVCTDTRYNRLLWNFGYHLAHHLEPRAHWTALPLIHAKLGLKEKTISARTLNYFGLFRPRSFAWRRPERRVG